MEDPAALSGSKLTTLYRAGAIAPLVAMAFYLVEFVSIISAGNAFPVTIEAWYRVFNEAPVRALLYFNALDIFSIAGLGALYLALYKALQLRNASWAALGTLSALIGIPVFMVPRVIMLSVVPLSQQYAAAEPARQAALLSAGELLKAMGAATPRTIGFLFIAVGTLILSAMMLNDERFSNATAITGIVAGAIVLLSDTVGLVVPSLVGPLLGLTGFVWLAWWTLISWALVRLAAREYPPRS